MTAPKYTVFFSGRTTADQRRRWVMTLEAFYAKIGGNSADVLRRLPSEAMVRKFIGKYPADTSWGSLPRRPHPERRGPEPGLPEAVSLQHGPHRGPARPQAPDRPRPARGRGNGPGRPADGHPGTGRLMPLRLKTTRRVSCFSLRPSNSPLRVGSKRLFVRVSARRGLFYDINWPELCHPVVWCVIPRLLFPEALGGCCRTAVPGGCGIFPPGDRPAPRRR